MFWPFQGYPCRLLEYTSLPRSFPLSTVVVCVLTVKTVKKVQQIRSAVTLIVVGISCNPAGQLSLVTWLDHDVCQRFASAAPLLVLLNAPSRMGPQFGLIELLFDSVARHFTVLCCNGFDRRHAEMLRVVTECLPFCFGGHHGIFHPWNARVRGMRTDI